MTEHASPRSKRDRERIGRDLLKDTPMKTETWNEEREREERHRQLPKDKQPYMVVFFGMLDYGVLWIGSDGGARENAEREIRWWQDRIREVIYVLPFTREPNVHDVQVRQQWDLDALAAAIHAR